jgi:hypothetical protein
MTLNTLLRKKLTIGTRLSIRQRYPMDTVTTNHHAYEGDQYSCFHTLSILIYLLFK